MTIVAKNSLTLSNVNDGTITHIAYANSADGTDGFYVSGGTNLAHRTSSDWQKVSVPSNDWGVTVLCDSIYEIVNGETYTIQVEVRNITAPVMLELWSFNVAGNRNSVLAPVQATNKDGKISITFTANLPDGYAYLRPNLALVTPITSVAGYEFRQFKVEKGSVATPWSPAPSEAHPSYIGQYTDFNTTASTDPAKYAPWIIFKGNDGTGIKTTLITYAISTSGITAPTTGWTSSVPSLVKGQYLWTKTVWTYTDNSSETGYSVTYISKDGATGKDGIAGKDGTGIQTTTITYAGSTSGTTAPTSGWTSTIPTVAAGSYLWTKTIWAYTDNTSKTGYSVAKMGNDGSNGDPGKIVSDTEPTTRFKGLTWKYSGTADLTASDGTVILSGTEYYWSGTNWILSEINAHNINGNNLTITDGEFSSTIIDGPVQIQTEIKDDHLLIYKMDTSHNEIHTIALKSDSGLGMTYQNSDTGEYTSAGVNFQGLFMQNNITNEFARLTPQGTKLSTDVPWTKLSLMNNFTGNIEYAIINGTVYISASGVGVPAMTAGQWKQAAQLPTGSSAIPIRANRITAGDSGDGLSWALLSNQAGGLFIRCSANKAATANLFNATLPYPIG